MVESELKNKLNTDYPIESIIQIENLDKGMTSEAKLIETLSKRYILRKMRDAKQAHTEYVISEKLASQSISPRIILTKQSESYIEYKESLYNLQIYIPHDSKSNQDINYFKMGETVSLLHQEVKSINGINEQADRFPLDKMMENLTHTKGIHKFANYSELMKLLEECNYFN